MAETHRRALTRVVALVMAFLMVVGLASCGNAPQPDTEAEATEDAAPVEVRVGYLPATASLGLMPLVGKARAGELKNDYSFTLVRGYKEAQASIESGVVDIVMLQPTKAVLSYHNTNGGVIVADVAALADWTFMSENRSVKSLNSLIGRTLYTMSKRSTEGITVRYLLEKAGLTDQVNVEYRGGDGEVAAALTADATTVGILSEPYVTVLRRMRSNLVKSMTMEEEWERLVGDGSKLVTHVMVVRKEFAIRHPEAVKEFVQAHAASVKAMTQDPYSYAETAYDFGLVSEAELCEPVVDGSNLVCISGAETKPALSGYLQMFMDYAPRVVGESLPEDDFYLADVDALAAEYANMTDDEMKALGWIVDPEATADSEADPDAEAVPAE